MQGYGQLLPDLFNTIAAFQSKLNLFQLQLSTGYMMQFQNMFLFMARTKTTLVPDFAKYATICENLCESFAKRFQNLKNREKHLSLFQRPFTANVQEIQDAKLQLERLDLKLNEVLKDVYQKPPIS